MSFITADYSKNQENDFSPLPEGEYEMVITQAGEIATKRGSESLQLRLTVRNDLDAAEPKTNGKYHNRVVFFDNWKRKATNQYDMDGLQYVLEATKIPEGTPLNSVDDFCKAIYHKPVRVYVKVEKTLNMVIGTQWPRGVFMLASIHKLLTNLRMILNQVSLMNRLTIPTCHSRRIKNV